MKLRALGVLFFLALVPLTAVAQTNAAVQATDPVAGTWVLNGAKSKIVPGPAPKRETRVYAVNGTQIALATTSVGADDKSVTVRSTYAYDGKDYPVTSSPDYDTQAVKRVDRSTVTAELKKAGKVVQTTRRTVSSDGKTLTLTFRGMNAKGQTVDDVRIYDKQ